MCIFHYTHITIKTESNKSYLQHFIASVGHFTQFWQVQCAAVHSLHQRPEARPLPRLDLFAKFGLLQFHDRLAMLFVRHLRPDLWLDRGRPAPLWFWAVVTSDVVDVVTPHSSSCCIPPRLGCVPISWWLTRDCRRPLTASAMSPSPLCATPLRHRPPRSCDVGEGPRADALPSSTFRRVRPPKTTPGAAQTTGNYWVCWWTRPKSA